MKSRWNRPVISTALAHEFGLTIETIAQASQRLFLDESSVRARIRRKRVYAFKQCRRWWVVHKNGEDLKDIIV